MDPYKNDESKLPPISPPARMYVACCGREIEEGDEDHFVDGIFNFCDSPSMEWLHEFEKVPVT